MQTTQAETRRDVRDDPRPPGATGASVAPGSTSLRRCLTLCAVIAAATILAEPVPAAASLTVIALIPAARIDLVERRLPNRMVAAGAVVGVISVIVSTILGSPHELTGALAGSAAMAIPLLALHLLAPDSMGFGDVKAAAVLGAALGLISPVLAVVGLVAASAGTAMFGLVTRQNTVPFGPGLVAGSTVALLIATSPIASSMYEVQSVSTADAPEVGCDFACGLERSTDANPSQGATR